MITYCLQLTTLNGCGPTYPKSKFNESIVKICKNEYKIDVKVETVGNTIAIYLPLENLIDFTFAITREASEKINDVILSVSRASLSTDAKFDFYCIIAHDIRIPEVQIVIIKSVDDVKRFLLNDISRGEYSKRMLVDIRLNPQAQKERAIKNVFERMGVDEKWQEQVMDEFFRSRPAGLGDIGYWNGRFYIKEIALPEFLAEQIAARVKTEVRDDAALTEAVTLKSVKGSYVPSEGKNFFKIEISSEPNWFNEKKETDIPKKLFHMAGKTAYAVVHGYRFKDFDYAEIVDENDGKTIRISKNALERFKPKNAKLEDVMEFDAY